MPAVHISFALKTILVALGAVVASGVSIFMYRITVPPIAKRLKTILTTLRSLGLFVVFLLIFEPLLSLVTKTTEPPLIALLVDNSKSMTIHSTQVDRKQEISKLLESTLLKNLSGLGALRVGVFSDRLRWLQSFWPDSLTLDGDATDISSVLRTAKEETRTANLQAVIVLSDGNSTAGSDPLYEAEDLGVPVLTLGVGDTVEQKDILIRKILTNEITYVGNRVPVTATVRSSGYEGQKVEILLKDEGKVLDRKVLTAESGTRDYEVPLTFIPDKEGMQKYSVEVSNLPGELTARNNRSNFFTKVLRSKMRVILIAGGPSSDVAFIRRALEADKNLEVKSFIERGNGQFYEGPLARHSLDDADCCILVGFPAASSNVASVSAVSNALGGGKPFFCILSRTLDYSKLRAFEQALPFVVQSGSTDEYQAFVDVPELQRTNPLLKLSTVNESGDMWVKLPPIFKTQSVFRAKPESEILALTRIQTTAVNEPFLVSRNVNGHKSLALLGYGVWRWAMLSEIGSGNVLEPFLSNAIRWLTTREDEKTVRVQPTKQVFTTQEPPEFVAQVYDQSYQPVDNAKIAVDIQHGRETRELILSSVGEGRYEGSLSQMEEGDYRFTAKITSDGKLLSDQQGRFSVGGISAEFLETKMNKSLLQRMSHLTGGTYHDVNAAQNIAGDIRSLPNFQPREQVHTSEIELWNYSWMLGFVLLIFSLEWFLRKRNGLL